MNLYHNFTERSFHSLAHLRKQELVPRRTIFSRKQYLGFFRQRLRGRLSSIAKTAKGDATISFEHQAESRVAFIPVGGC
jgi:hypothetical protein